MSVGSMLRECGLTKADVRRIAAKNGRIVRWSLPTPKVDFKTSGYKVEEGKVVTDKRSIEAAVIEYHLESFRQR